MIRKDAKNMGYHEGKKNRRQGLCRGGWDCYDRMYVHRGTVIQLKQEVSEITDFVMAVGRNIYDIRYGIIGFNYLDHVVCVQEGVHIVRRLAASVTRTDGSARN